MAIDTNGRWYVWGAVFSGKVLAPTKLHKIFYKNRRELAPIASMDVSTEFTLVINQSGDVYSWNHGQDIGHEEVQLSKIDPPNSDTKIWKAAWGHNFVVALGRTLIKQNHQEEDRCCLRESISSHKSMNLKTKPRSKSSNCHNPTHNPAILAQKYTNSSSEDYLADKSVSLNTSNPPNKYKRSCSPLLTHSQAQINKFKNLRLNLNKPLPKQVRKYLYIINFRIYLIIEKLHYWPLLMLIRYWRM